MKNLEKLTNIIESILFVSGSQVAIADITDKLGISNKELDDAVTQLQQKYSADSGIQLLKFNKKLQFCSNPVYAEEVSSVLNPIKERELSKSMLEVAAIIAYKQPVTRIDLEEIRGNSEYALQKLLELGVVEPVGRKDAVGRPVLFGTTDKFLKRFQIESLDELPDYEELINRIQLIHGVDDADDYLYKKDVYTETENEAIVDFSTQEESEENKEKVNITDNIQKENTKNNKNKENSLKKQKKNTEITHNEEDFDLPDVEEEEIPDFLKGEDIEKF